MILHTVVETPELRKLKEKLMEFNAQKTQLYTQIEFALKQEDY